MRVLVVDDDASSLLFAAKLVEGLGHGCDRAPSAEEAWAELLLRHYDVLLTDLAMPGEDGLGLCRRLRATTEGSYTYVICMTSSRDSAGVVDAMRAGADDYITKPLSRTEVEAGFIAASRVVELQRRLQLTARVDALTGLRNRLALAESMSAMNARVERYGHAFSVALIDLDRFKLYNDTYGHPSGDDVLRRVAAVLQAGGRTGDEAFRFGGEELLWLLPEQEPEEAAIAAERLRADIESLQIPHVPNEPHEVVTVSVGIASSSEAGGRSSDVIGAADRALYAAKRSGRNRLVRT